MNQLMQKRLEILMRIKNLCKDKNLSLTIVAKIYNPIIKNLRKTTSEESFNQKVSKISDMLEATNSEMEFFYRMKEKYPEELKYLTEEDILEQ